MAGLLDIAPLSSKVSIRGTAVDVCGVSAKGIAQLILRFPELREMMVGREVSVDRLLGIGGDAVAAIIAAGCGDFSAEAEAAAAALSIDEQADLLGAILKLTMPGGLAPLVEKLSGVLSQHNGGAA